MKGEWGIQLESDLWKVLSKVKVPPRSGVGLQFSAESTFVDWFKAFLSGGRVALVDELLMVAWGIWKARNELLWPDRPSQAADVVRVARSCHSSWLLAQENRFELLLFDATVVGSSVCWEKPPVGKLKINTDGAIFEATTQYGTGMVIRDCHGKLIEASASLHSGACQPAVAEVLSVKEALSWLKSKNLSNVLVETDCIAVVQALNSSVALPSVFGLFVQECQLILSSIHNVSICHVKRSANKVAH
ncbi:uncharacterized protein LOC133034359 [Cannabis sativa]|uniref:uncharacterized protein LOC133034359 n=1 Tax=Cannabis sativa TaxID=3483 RepID=UPI0029CA25CE|nr:uncharacterized protein LOC133034359 [Cannabis sativa]